MKNGMGGASKGFVGRMRRQESCDEEARITYHGKSTFADRLIQLTGDRDQPRLTTREQLGPRALPRVQVVAKHGHYPEYPAMVPSQINFALGATSRASLRACKLAGSLIKIAPILGLHQRHRRKAKLPCD